MYTSLRSALLAGALLVIGTAAYADAITISEALRQGGENSPRIAAAKAQSDASEARARQAGVSPNPELALDVENFVGTGPFQGLGGTETTLAVSQRLERGGKRGARMKVAEAERDYAYLNYRRIQADLDYDIRVAYAQLRAAEERVDLARVNLRNAQELARTSGILVDVGRDPPLRKLRADSLLAQAEADLAGAEGELRIARQRLASLIGSSDPQLSAANMPFDAPPPPLAIIAPNIDVRLAEAELDAANARVALAQTDAVPDITVSGGVRHFNASGDAALVAGVSIPLPFRDRNKGNIEAAQSDVWAAESRVNLARIEADQGRYDAETKLRAADSRIASLERSALPQATEALRLAQLGYQAGKFSLVELIDAQSALNDVRTALIQARLDRALAIAALYRANAQ